MTVSDTSRAIQHDPDTSYPTSVTLLMTWNVNGLIRSREVAFSADQFFGHGQYGAPLPGDAVISAIERMRRAGPPVPQPLKRPRTKPLKTGKSNAKKRKR